MRIDKKATISLWASLGIHALFLLFSANTKFMDKAADFDKKERLFIVKTVETKKANENIYHQSELDSSEAVKFEQPSLIDEGNELLNQNELLIKEIAKADLPEERTFSESVNTQTNLLKEVEKQSNYLKKKEERKTREDIIEVSIDKSLDDSEGLVNALDVSKDFVDRMPGFTPGSFTQGEGALKIDQETSAKGVKSSVVKRSLTSEEIDRLFGGDVIVYEDPEDGQKYFQLKISAAQNEDLLPVLPKEIIFLIDCSISIEQERLNEFKKGVEHSLMHLSENDYFNVIAFKENIDKFKKNPVKPTKENIHDALKFIENLTAGQKTDTYGALFESINLDSAVKPSYIFLLSDGRPTKGITDSQKVINEISKANDGKISIFAFSGGSWVNRYLLDFITYKNRGWTEYSGRSHMIGESLGNMYDKIGNPVLLNLRYYASGIDTNEIFPRNLPDLYQNVEFTLYGKFKDEDKFVLQLNSTVNGKTKTYTMARSLKNAQKGDKEIAKNWAFNKIYHLIGSLKEENENKEIVSQINILSKKFKINTPYQGKAWKK